MKKIFTTLVAIFAITQLSYAQWTSSGNDIHNTNSGNVGIGTTTPFAKLTIPNASAANGGYLGFDVATNGASRRWWISPDVVTFGDFAVQTESTKGNASPDLTRFYINPSGNVGIGTTTPHEALSVNGNIRSKQVKVELANWPDYVFKPTYSLPSLLEVKTYIDKYQHLPDMPSEAEVAKDGLNLGEINKLLTKKVEELTLYLIQQNKQLEQQTRRINKLENRLSKTNRK